MEGITYRRSSLSSQTNRGESTPCLIVGLFHIHLMTYNVDYMTRADGNFCAYYSNINFDNCFQRGKL